MTVVVSERDVFYDSCWFVIDSQKEGVQRDKLMSICIERVKMMELAVSAYWILKLQFKITRDEKGRKDERRRRRRYDRRRGE